MEFLHPLLAAGAATFAVPVIIHLIFRARKKRLVFSTIRFLKISMLRENKRLKLREWLLLLLRCAACILVALAFARPYFDNAALAGKEGDVREDLIIVLDDSPSMNAQDGNASRWAQAKKSVQRLCEAAHPGDRIGLVLGSEPGRPEVELSSNFTAVPAAVKPTGPSSLHGDLSRAVSTAFDQLENAINPKRHVIVLSDFQATQIDRGAWADLARRATAPAKPITVDLLNPSGEKKTAPALNNIGITEVRSKSDVWIDGRPLTFAVRVENFGAGEFPDVPLKLIVGEGPGETVVAQRTFALGPHAIAEVDISAVLPKAGPVRGRAEIAGHDAFPEDDRRSYALKLRDSVHAVVIEDNLQATKSFQDQSYFLRMALAPQARTGDGTIANGDADKNYISVRPFSAMEVKNAQLVDADVVFLVGVSELPTPTLAALEDWVAKGHNLVIFAGNSTGSLPDSFYSGPFWKGGKGLLPARLGQRYVGDLLENRFDGVDTFKTDHPLFQVFTGENERELRRPKFLKHYKLDSADLKTTPEREAGTILGTFNNDGTPWAVERPFGKGKVLLFPFGLRPEDSELPVRKVFVPFIHQLVRYFAGFSGNANRNIIAGESIAFSELGLDSTEKITLTRPNKEKQTFAGADSATLDLAGTYDAAYSGADKQTKQDYWAANFDPLESALNPEDLSNVQTLFVSNAQASPTQPDSKKAREAALEEWKSQAPNWRYFLVAALCCLLLEVWVRDFWGSHR